MKRVDTLGFLAPQGMAPFADPELGEHLDVMHFTAVAPPMRSTDEILNGGRFPGLFTTRQLLDYQLGIQVVETAERLKEATEEGKTAIVLGLQQTPYDVNRKTVETFHRNGIRIITPVYQEANHPIGSGFTDPEGPLTDKGRQFILDCAEVGLIIDLSHVGHTTARHIMDFRDRGNPFTVMASHGGIYEEFDGNQNGANNLRNLPKDVLQRVAEAGGVIGVYALTFGLSDKDNSLDPILYQVHKALDLVGEDAVALGTDSVYRARDVAEWRKTVEMMTSLVAPSGELEPRFPDTPISLNTVDKIDVIASALAHTGLPENVIEKVAGQNAYDFLARAL